MTKRSAVNAEQEMRETARKLLEGKQVGVVVGYARGTASMRSKPAFIRDPKDADRLIFDSTCGISLAPHLRKVLRSLPKGAKAAVVAKGCDGRALVEYIAEGQFKRDDVVIVGVACDGAVDRRKAEGGKRKAGSVDVAEANREVLSDSCLRCRYPNPPVYDVLVAEPGDAASGDEYAEVAEFERLGADERWAWFERELAKCIRCYACRNACPMCYCEECFVDQTNPQWFGKSAEQPDTMMFHIVRALHTAGRCVDCGACERACPLGVRLGLLNKRIEREVKERFGYTAGLSLDMKPAMAAYDEEDRQEFIL